jgi:succinoglycan biosynthesis protein ExoA
MEHSHTASLATISVIVPVRNEERFIERTLDYLLAQDRTQLALEIRVVDGESTDRTVEIVRRMAGRHPEIELHTNPRRMSSAARNIGIRHSTGDIVLIIDGHCELHDPQHLRKLMDAFQTSQADCLGRPQPLDVTDATPLQKAIAAARTSRLGHHPESFIYATKACFVPAKSVAVAYRRSVFEKVGYFDERFDAHEDGEFNYRVDRAGLKCFFTPDIAVTYFPRRSLRALFRQMVRYGKGRVRFSRKHPGTWGWGVLVPALFVLYIVLGGVLSVMIPALAVLYVGGLSVHAAVVSAFSVAIAVQTRSLAMLPWLPLVFATVHVGAGVGLLSEVVMPAERSQADS